MAEKRSVNNYYVDEAGDLTLFNKRGHMIVGKEGVSRVFMVGVAYLPDPKPAHHKLEQLRTELLGDPYFKDVPSMQPEKNKTAICFHAKDDLPEVRRRALEKAIGKAKINFEKKTGIRSESETVIFSAYPSQYAGLQVIDYYLWALQRMFERGEDRFFHLLAPAYRLIMDLDDTRNKPYGEWYSDSNPLELKKIKPVAG